MWTARTIVTYWWFAPSSSWVALANHQKLVFAQVIYFLRGKKCFHRLSVRADGVQRGAKRRLAIPTRI